MKTLDQLYKQDAEDGCALNSVQWYTLYVHLFNRERGADLNDDVPLNELIGFIEGDI